MTKEQRDKIEAALVERYFPDTFIRSFIGKEIKAISKLINKLSDAELCALVLGSKEKDEEEK
jgi:hypothetical protein